MTGERQVVDLLALPGLGSLYVRGAAGSLTRRPGGGPLTLPSAVHRVAGVRTGDTATAARLAAYARVVGEPMAEVLPAGFLHVLAFPLATGVMVRGDFPLPLLGTVHLRNSVRVTRPVRLGDTLEVRAWAADLRPHRRGAQVDLVAEVSVTGPAGPELAWRGVSTYLAKGFHAPDGTDGGSAGVSLGGTGSIGEGGVGVGGSDSLDAAELTAGPAREEWAPPLPTGRWVLGAGTGRAYGAVSGDRNPIHTSALGAKAFGYPRAIAHGMYTAARALAEVGPARRGETYEWTVEFFRPVLLPSTVDVAIRRSSEGYRYDGWRSGTGPRHFAGTVAPLRPV